MDSSRISTAPAGKLLLDALQRTHLSFFHLHVLASSLLSRALAFSVLLRPPPSTSTFPHHQNGRGHHPQRQHRHNHPLGGAGTNDCDSVDEDDGDGDGADDGGDGGDGTSASHTITHDDVLRLTVLGLPVTAADVAASAAAFRRHADFGATVAYAVEHHVASRRDGASAEHAGSFDATRETSEGVALVTAVFDFLSDPDAPREGLGLPETWSARSVAMARARVFRAMALLLVRGLFHRYALDGTRPRPLAPEARVMLLAFEQRQQQADMELLAWPGADGQQPQQRGRSHHHKHVATYPLALAADIASRSDEYARALTVDTCPEGCARFPSAEAHFLRTTQDGLLHDAMNSYAADDDVPLLHIFQRDCAAVVDAGSPPRELHPNADAARTHFSGVAALHAFLACVVAGGEAAHDRALWLMMSTEAQQHQQQQEERPQQPSPLLPLAPTRVLAASSPAPCPPSFSSAGPDSNCANDDAPTAAGMKASAATQQQQQQQQNVPAVSLQVCAPPAARHLAPPQYLYVLQRLLTHPASAARERIAAVTIVRDPCSSAASLAAFSNSSGGGGAATGLSSSPPAARAPSVPAAFPPPFSSHARRD